jgi:chemotaxis protein methyltransferase CheR
MIPPDLLQQTKTLIADQLGWEFGTTRAKDFERGLQSMARELGIKDSPESISEWLRSIKWSARELDILTKYLTVGETYFFRENPQFELFSQQIIPELVAERSGNDQTLKIWSAGCCTGEEAYSLATLLYQILPDLHHWNIMILGTDINRAYLEKARKGIYSSWSFRVTPPAFQQQFFRKNGSYWEVVPEIKRMVSFTLLNLAENSYPSAISHICNMDVIFCRNVLMYFTPEQTRAVTHRFYETLNPKGWLVPSAVELNDAQFHDFSTVHSHNSIVYRKIPKHHHQRNTEPVSLPIQNAKISGSLLIPRKKVSGVPDFRHVPAPKPHPNPEKKNTGKTAAESFHSGEYHHCIESALKLLESGHLHADNIALIVKSYANLGNLQEAHKWGVKLLSLSGTDASHYYLVATILLELNDAPLAEEMLKRALYINPHHILSQYLMGTIAVKLGKKQSGKKHFKNVLELLEPFQDFDIVPDADGLTAGRFRQMVQYS